MIMVSEALVLKTSFYGKLVGLLIDTFPEGSYILNDSKVIFW
jgi:hypothetical protein